MIVTVYWQKVESLLSNSLHVAGQKDEFFMRILQTTGAQNHKNR